MKIYLSAKYFRLILVIVSIAFAFAGISYQYKKYKFAEDERILVELPSRVMVLNSVASVLPQREEKIPTGSLIIEIEKINIDDTSLLESVFMLPKEVLGLKFFDCQKNLTRTIYVKKDELRKSKFYRLRTGALVYRFDVVEMDKGEVPTPGDLIVKINGKEFSNPREADLIIENAPANLPLEIEFLRCGERRKALIYQTKYRIDFATSLHLIASLLFFTFGLFMGLKYSNHFPIRLLSFAMVLLSFVLLEPTTNRIDNSFLNKYWAVSLVFTSTLGIGLFSHFCFYFPVRQLHLIEKRRIVYLNYFISGLFALLFLGFSLKDLFHFKDTYFFTVIVVFLIYHLAIRLSFRKQIVKDPTNSVRLFYFYVIFIGFLTVLTLFNFEAFVIPKVNFQLLFYFSFALLPFVLFYYLQKFKYYDIVLNVRRNYLYLTTKFLLDLTSILAVGFLLYLSSNVSIKFPNLHLVGTTIEVLNRPLPADRNFRYEKLAVAIGFTLCLYLILLFRNSLGNYLRKKFYHSHFDYRRTAVELSELIVSNVELEVLARNVIQQLENTLFPKKSLLLIFKNNKVYFRDYSGDVNPKLIENLANNVNLYEFLRNSESSVIYSDALFEPLRGEFIEAGFVLCVPIRHSRKLVGALFVGEKLSEAKFATDDIEFLSIICKNIAIAIVNSFYVEELARQERYKQEIEIAQKIQLALLPKEIPEIETMEISAVTIPALEVGGDFYDFLRANENELLIVAGDVSGKGLSAAFYMSQIQGIFRTLNTFDFSIKELLSRANGMLCRWIEKGYFISAILCNFELSNSIVSFVRAGHLGLYYFNFRENKAVKIVPKGVALGIVSNEKFEKNLEVVTFRFNIGDIFLFVSDGVIEKIREGKLELAENEILSILEKFYYLSADELKEKILTDVCFSSGATYLRDDITILVVKPVKNG